MHQETSKYKLSGMFAPQNTRHYLHHQETSQSNHLDINPSQHWTNVLGDLL